MRALLSILLLFTLLGCKTVERAEETPRAVRSTPNFTGEMPNMLRGTIKQHVALMGYAESYSDQYQPVVAAGYGLVVGLNGTGSSEFPPQIRSHMIADFARRGFGESTRGWGEFSPEELLNSKETAVVIVEAVIPQAASGRKPTRAGMSDSHPSLRGTTFDVHVYAEPSGGTTSLEGGTLLPTLLRPGQLTTGRLQAREIGAASGRRQGGIRRDRARIAGKRIAAPAPDPPDGPHPVVAGRGRKGFAARKGGTVGAAFAALKRQAPRTIFFGS